MLFWSSSLTLSVLAISFPGSPQVSRETAAALTHLGNEVRRSLDGALPQGPGAPLGSGLRTGSGGLAAGLIAPMASLAANGVRVVHLGGRRRGPDPPNPFAQAMSLAFDGSPCTAETPGNAARSGAAAASTGSCSRSSDHRHSKPRPAAARDGGRESASVPIPGGSPSGTSPSWGHLSKYMQPRGGAACSGALVEVTEAAAFAPGCICCIVAGTLKRPSCACSGIRAARQTKVLVTFCQRAFGSPAGMPPGELSSDACHGTATAHSRITTGFMGACVVAKQGRFGVMNADLLREPPAQQSPKGAVQVRPSVVAPLWCPPHLTSPPPCAPVMHMTYPGNPPPGAIPGHHSANPGPGPRTLPPSPPLVCCSPGTLEG